MASTVVRFGPFQITVSGYPMGKEPYVVIEIERFNRGSKHGEIDGTPGDAYYREVFKASLQNVTQQTKGT